MNPSAFQCFHPKNTTTTRQLLHLFRLLQWRRGRCTMHSPSPFFGKSPKSSSHLRIFPLEQNPRQTNVQLKIKTLLSKITLPRPEHECSSVFHLRSRVATKSYRKCFSSFFETDFLCICPIWNVGYPHTAPEALQLSTSTLFSWKQFGLRLTEQMVHFAKMFKYFNFRNKWLHCPRPQFFKEVVWSKNCFAFTVFCPLDTSTSVREIWTQNVIIEKHTSAPQIPIKPSNRMCQECFRDISLTCQPSCFVIMFSKLT